ncbi:MAG: sulfate adenylyltransferase subunit CysN [Pseudomonadales bacterium]|nr:sulfate adenylyltransferase subunit CysN [Pseudomonadales bacterium]
MSHQSELISNDIESYLAEHERKELMRLLTCGSVDDGKSTLIGRLLHDSKMIYEDQLEAVKADSVKSGTTGEEVDLALLVDGLQAEREQGITIDVAYRYFSTSKRKFIIADTPGHEQYTRNMATGASTCDLAIILIDARYGILTQTRRHSYITSLLGIKHVLVAVNKMDLVDYSEEVFNKICADYVELAKELEIEDIRFIPLSALTGCNVVHKSEHTPWYQGPALMETLETIEIGADANFEDMRLPVQYVNRPNLDFRGFCGTLAGGIVRKGDEIVALPSGKTTKVSSIISSDGEVEEAFPPMAITLTTEDEIDISRGDTITLVNNRAEVSNRFDANIVWMDESACLPGKQYYIKLGANMVSGSIAKVIHRTDINTFEKHTDANQLQLNEIALCQVTTNTPVAFDAYSKVKGTGAFILIDRLTNITVGAGMISSVSVEGSDDQSAVTEEQRQARYGHKPALVSLTGEGADKLAQSLERQLFDRGCNCLVLGKDIAVASEAIAQIAEVGGLIVICQESQNSAASGALVIDSETVNAEGAVALLLEAGIFA